MNDQSTTIDIIERLALEQPGGQFRELTTPKSSSTGKELEWLNPIQKITHKHHALAQLVAEGLKDTEIAAMTGYTPQRIYQLRNDQMFVDLVNFYAAEVKAKYLDTHERRQRVGRLALARIEEKLLDDDIVEKLGLKTLTEVAQFAIDGQGKGQIGGPASGPIAVNITFHGGQQQGQQRGSPSFEQGSAFPANSSIIDITPTKDS